MAITSCLAPKYLLRDWDSIYGAYFRQRVKNMGIKEVITAAQSPWQNPFVERLIGSIRRDCLDHVIVVLNESHLSRILSSYFDYYHYDRTHYGLGKDTPVERPVQPSSTAYWLRHTYAQNLLEAGSSIFEIKEMLGHDKIESTKLYLHVHLKLMRKVLFDETF